MCKDYGLKINEDPTTDPAEGTFGEGPLRGGAFGDTKVEFNGSVLEHVEVADLDDVVVSFKTTSASSIKNK